MNVMLVRNTSTPFSSKYLKLCLTLKEALNAYCHTIETIEINEELVQRSRVVLALATLCHLLTLLELSESLWVSV